MSDFDKDMFGEEYAKEQTPETPEMPEMPVFSEMQEPVAPEKPADPFNTAPNVEQQNQYNMPINQSAPQQTYNAPSSNPFAQQATAYAGPKPSTGLATASMILGILSIVLWLFMFMFPPLFLLPIIGLILGIVHKTKHLPVGKGASTAGIVTSVIALVLCIAFIVIIVVVMLNSSELMYNMLEIIKDTYPDMYNDYYNQFYSEFPEWFDGAIKMLGCFFMK